RILILDLRSVFSRVSAASAPGPPPDREPGDPGDTAAVSRSTVFALAELRGLGEMISVSALLSLDVAISLFVTGVEESGEGRRRVLTLAGGLDVVDGRLPAPLGGLTPGLVTEETDDCLVLWAGSGGGPIDVLDGLGLTPTLDGRVLEGVFVRELEALDAGRGFVGDFVGDYATSVQHVAPGTPSTTNPYPRHARRPGTPGPGARTGSIKARPPLRRCLGGRLARA